MKIKWSKTSQFGEKDLFLPMIISKKLHICPVKWCLYMIDKIPVKGFHNLFSFRQHDVTVPVTYNDLTKQMCSWL